MKEPTKEEIIKISNENIKWECDGCGKIGKGFTLIDIAHLYQHAVVLCKKCLDILKSKLIGNQPPIKKSLMKLAEDLGVSFSATKIISDHAQPEVDEKFIEIWAQSFVDASEGKIDIRIARAKVKAILFQANVRIKEGNENG